MTGMDPEPAGAPRGPSPTTSVELEKSDHMSGQPTGTGACPKTYTTAHHPRGQISDSDEEDSPSTTDS